MTKTQLTFCSELVFFPCFCALLQTVLTDKSGKTEINIKVNHGEWKSPCQADRRDSPGWPDDLVVQDTNLMHLPSTVFTFNKPEERWEKCQSASRDILKNHASETRFSQEEALVSKCCRGLINCRSPNMHFYQTHVRPDVGVREAPLWIRSGPSTSTCVLESVFKCDLRFRVEHVVLLAFKLVFWYPPKDVINEKQLLGSQRKDVFTFEYHWKLLCLSYIQSSVEILMKSYNSQTAHKVLSKCKT